jgi:uncharacterized protein YpuA (DUF1002 family)
MGKKILTALAALCFTLVVAVFPAFAASGDFRVTIGADNTAEQLGSVYGFFRINRGDVPEITVTNAEERHYLAGLVPEEKIGSVALSCSYIEVRGSGGVEMETYNINWVTKDMYRNALATAGISNARVIVAAYKPVSGTGALAGIYKAYEAITGKVIDETLKEVAAEELVVTGDLQGVLGDASPEFINELKAKLELTKGMTDDEIRVLIVETAEEYDAELTNDQVEQILELIKKMNALGVDPDTFIKLAKTGQDISDGARGFFESVGNFFQGIGDFFSNLFRFGGNN